MAFYVYDPKRFHPPPSPCVDWERTQECEPTSSFDSPHDEHESSETVEEDKEKNTAHLELPPQHVESQAKPSLLAFQIMSCPVQTLPPQTCLPDAYNFFTIHCYRHIPIVDTNGHLMGILSSRKLGYMFAYSRRRKGKTSLQEIHVEDIMETYLLTTTPKTEVTLIANLFIEVRLHCMLVLDIDQHLIGMITKGDLIRGLGKSRLSFSSP